MQNSLFMGGLHDGDPLKSMIMLKLQQFLENHIFEKKNIKATFIIFSPSQKRKNGYFIMVVHV